MIATSNIVWVRIETSLIRSLDARNAWAMKFTSGFTGSAANNPRIRRLR
jgi:hypothetical protein